MTQSSPSHTLPIDTVEDFVQADMVLFIQIACEECCQE